MRLPIGFWIRWWIVSIRDKIILISWSVKYDYWFVFSRKIKMNSNISWNSDHEITICVVICVPNNQTNGVSLSDFPAPFVHILVSSYVSQQKHFAGSTKVSINTFCNLLVTQNHLLQNHRKIENPIYREHCK